MWQPKNGKYIVIMQPNSLFSYYNDKTFSFTESHLYDFEYLGHNGDLGQDEDIANEAFEVAYAFGYPHDYDIFSHDYTWHI